MGILLSISGVPVLSVLSHVHFLFLLIVRSTFCWKSFGANMHPGSSLSIASNNFHGQETWWNLFCNASPICQAHWTCSGPSHTAFVGHSILHWKTFTDPLTQGPDYSYSDRKINTWRHGSRWSKFESVRFLDGPDPHRNSYKSGYKVWYT